VDYTSFLAATVSCSDNFLKNEGNSILGAFHVLDTDHDGYITAADLTTAFDGCISQSTSKHIIGSFHDHPSRISFEEFKRAILELMTNDNDEHSVEARTLVTALMERTNAIGSDTSRSKSRKQLLAESSNQERGGRLALVDGREISSILITPTPTLSTIFNTVSFVTTVTKNITQLLHLNFAGRRIPTEIVSQSVVVSTSSSVESSTIEITPTPTWQTIVVTPTVTQPPPPPPTPTIDYTALLQKKETERLQLLARIQSLQSQGVRLPPTFGGTRAQVVEIPEKLESFSSLQQYLEQVRQHKAGGEILALPLVALEPSLPTTSISTIFMSGSRPGEYSTSLMTITRTPEARARSRREAGEPGTLLVTAAPFINHQVDLEGSFLSPSPPLCPSAVTVTVTEQFCQP